MSVRRFSPWREAAIGLGAYALHLAVRRAVVNERGFAAADRNARAIVALERRLGVHAEPAIQRAFLARPPVVAVANASYVTLNVGLTVGWLALLFARRDPAFHRLRRAWAIATIAAQPVHVALPTAPPRKLDGFTDTVHHAGIDLDSGPVSRLYDPIAAMPSLHMAYAILTAAGMARTARSRVVRALAPAYAPGIAVVVVGTANHFVLDVVAGAALGAGALRLADRQRSRSVAA